MIGRAAAAVIRDRLRLFPGVVLLGPRQSGKTTLARALADRHGTRAVYLDLELPSVRARLSDPELYLDSYEDRLIVIDEIHRAPGLFQVLRGIIDHRRRQGIRSRQFLLLGSASMDLMRQSSESLAGRICYVELTPLTVAEVAGPTRRETVEPLWIRGGFPDSFLARRDQASLDWRLAFIQTYLERDLPALGPRVPAETLHRFWQMLAHNQGQMLNAARLAAALGVSGQTVARYLDILVDLLLVRRLHPWARNRAKRLVRSPKVYVRDSGLVHALLGLGDRDAVLGHPVAGASWEGFVIEQLLSTLPPQAEACFYRSAAGAEIDLVLDLGHKRRWAIEVKRSVGSPHPSKGFHLAAKDVGATRKIVVYPGREVFRLDPATEVLPVAVIERELRGA